MASDKIKFSIIVPAFEAEATIERCVESIVCNNQNVEVIIINDGSTDGTYDKCEILRSRYENVLCIHKENEGPGVARQVAIKYVTGDYIGFVDADDFVEPHAYDDISKYLDSKKVDIIEFNFKRIDGERETSVSGLNEVALYGDAVALHYARRINTTDYLWNKIFSKHLFEDVEHVRLFASEDAVILTQLFCNANSYQLIDEKWYNYVLSEGSLCRAEFSEKKLDNIKGNEFIKKYYALNHPELEIYADFNFAYKLIWLYCECRDSEYRDKKEVLKMIKIRFNEIVNIKVLILVFRKISLKRGILLGVFKISSCLGAYVYSLYKGSR